MEKIIISDGIYCDNCIFLFDYKQDEVYYGKCKFFKEYLHFHDWWLKDEKCTEKLAGKTFILKEIEND